MRHATLDLDLGKLDAHMTFKLAKIASLIIQSDRLDAGDVGVHLDPPYVQLYRSAWQRERPSFALVSFVSTGIFSTFHSIL